MKSFDYDLRYLKAGVDELENYLLSENLYWPLDVKAQANEPAFPNLTLGNLLLSKARLLARHRTLEQDLQLGAILPRLDQVRSQWRAAWNKKAARSLHSRLNTWRDFLEEYRKAPDAHYDRYAYEVGRRVMLDLLLPELGAPQEELTGLLSQLDALLQTFLLPGNFIWDAELVGGFPPAAYWYLYGSLPEKLEPT